MTAIQANLSGVARSAVSRLSMFAAAIILGTAVASTVGDPVSQLATPHASITVRDTLSRELGLDHSFRARVLIALSDVAQGEWGHSWQTGEPVARMLRDALAVSLDLAVAAGILMAVLSLPLALVASRSPTSPAILLLAPVCVIVMATPVIVTTTAGITVFSAELAWLPAYGRGATASLLGWQTGLVTADGLRALVLPALLVSAPLAAWTLRLLHAEAHQVRSHGPYVIGATARGLSERIIGGRHVLPNAALPVIASLGGQFGNLLTFAIITEAAFQRPGLGLMLLTAIEHADRPVIQVLIFVIAVLFTLANLIADAALFLVDPRIRPQAAAR